MASDAGEMAAAAKAKTKRRKRAQRATRAQNAPFLARSRAATRWRATRRRALRVCSRRAPRTHRIAQRFVAPCAGALNRVICAAHFRTKRRKIIGKRGANERCRR
jgi:hypothetical protein